MEALNTLLHIWHYYKHTAQTDQFDGLASARTAGCGCIRLESQQGDEKQFNSKVEINRALREAMAQQTARTRLQQWIELADLGFVEVILGRAHIGLLDAVTTPRGQPHVGLGHMTSELECLVAGDDASRQ